MPFNSLRSLLPVSPYDYHAPFSFLCLPTPFQATMMVKLYLTLIFFPLVIFAIPPRIHVNMDFIITRHSLGPPPDEIFLEAVHAISESGGQIQATLERSPFKPSWTVSADTTEIVINGIIVRNKQRGWERTMDYVLRRFDMPPLRLITFTHKNE